MVDCHQQINLPGHHDPFHYRTKVTAGEYYHQHCDPFHHRHGVVELNFQRHDSLHFHCVVEFPPQLYSDLTKKHYPLQIEHYPDHSADKLIVCYIELFQVAVFLQVIYIDTSRKLFPASSVNTTFVGGRKDNIV